MESLIMSGTLNMTQIWHFQADIINMESVLMESQVSEITNKKRWHPKNVSSLCFWLLWEGVVGGVVKTGVQEHGQGAQRGDDDKQPEEEAVRHEGDVLPVSCHLQGTQTFL